MYMALDIFQKIIYVRKLVGISSFGTLNGISGCSSTL